MRNYRQFDIWQLAHQLALEAYHSSGEFPSGERYGLTSQLRRAAVSVPANIAEGSGRPSDADFARFLGIALGSLSEFDYHLILARDLGYVDESISKSLGSMVADLRRMMTRFRSTVLAGQP